MRFLAEIVEETRRSIHGTDYWEGLEPAAPGPGPSLKRAIERDRGRGAVIVEYKRVSPGSPEPELPARSADEFVRAVAGAPPTAFSCLASIPRFRGRPADVAEVRRASGLPVLFKEFVIDPVQLDAAARAGASAVLLIARLAGRDAGSVPIERLAEAAHERGLEVLLEFHARAELNRAKDVAADMYGVNVRDLDSLRIDRPTAEATLAAARDLRPLLGLSGVEGPNEARRFFAIGADGILVGSAVARAADPAGFVRSLRRPEGPP